MEETTKEQRQETLGGTEAIITNTGVCVLLHLNRVHDRAKLKYILEDIEIYPGGHRDMVCTCKRLVGDQRNVVRILQLNGSRKKS